MFLVMRYSLTKDGPNFFVSFCKNDYGLRYFARFEASLRFDEWMATKVSVEGIRLGCA